MKVFSTVLLAWILSCCTGWTQGSDIWAEGYIIINGEEQPGFLRLAGTTSSPWNNCTKVYYVAPSDFPADLKPSRKSIQAYTPKDIDGYSIISHHPDTFFSGNVYVTEEVILATDLGKKKKKVFLREVVNGPVTIYVFVPEPEDNTDQEKEYAINHATTYYRKGDGPLIPALECNMSELLQECPEVVSKIKSGEYGYEDIDTRPKKKGLGKIMADNIGYKDLQGKINRSVFDYNRCMK